jgi:serine phosphatase RsbU (regulator of sigma subunit)
LLQADSGEIDVQDGDLVVLATDGVWDNFSPDLQKAPPQFPVSRAGEQKLRHHPQCLLTGLSCSP